MKRTIIVACALLTSLPLGSALLLAQQTAPAAPGKKRLVHTDAETVRNKPLPSGNNFTTLVGAVVIQSEDATLTTEKATYDGDTQIASAPTRLRLDDKQNTLTGDKGVAFYSTRDAEFTGNIVINARPKANDTSSAPKSSLRHEFKDPVTITCEKVRYNWQTKKAVLTGNLTIKQKDRTITGERGLYDGNAEIATLVGNIKSRRPTGESGDAPGPGARAVVSFKEGDEYVQVSRDPGLKDGRVHTVVPVREKPGGGAEYVDTVDTPSAPAAAPGPSASPAPLPAPTRSPSPPTQPNNGTTNP